MELKDVWLVGSVLVGFQLLAFSTRLSREWNISTESRGNEVNWLPLCDYVNLCSMLVLVVGVFIVPVYMIQMGKTPEMALGPAEKSLVLSLTLLLGYPFAMAGHYRLFVPQRQWSRPYCTLQEAIVITLLLASTAVLMSVIGFFHHYCLNLLIPLIFLLAVLVIGIFESKPERP